MNRAPVLHSSYVTESMTLEGDDAVGVWHPLALIDTNCNRYYRLFCQVLIYLFCRHLSQCPFGVFRVFMMLDVDSLIVIGAQICDYSTL